MIEAVFCSASEGCGIQRIDGLSPERLAALFAIQRYLGREFAGCIDNENGTQIGADSRR
jgi:hypothetical protein